MRHTAFWLVMLILFQSSYLIPKNYFTNWDVNMSLPALKQLGLFRYYLFILLNSSRGLAFQMIFTYTLLYILTPKYLLGGKYPSFLIAAFLLVIVIIILFTYVGKYTNRPICSLFDLPAKKLNTGYFLKCGSDNFLFNAPTVAGIALSVKLLKRWWLKQNESQQLIIAKSKAELQLLKAQVHPHFLFNTLNNIYSLTLSASPKAPEMVKKLSGLLHYIIYECNQPQVTLEKEYKMLQDYMALEKIRYGEQMDMTIDIRGNYSDKTIAPLLLIPLVENSFKHGTSKMLSKPWVNLNIIIENDTLYFMLNNSKPDEYINTNGKNGIGLINVQKRLQLLYPGRYEFKTSSEPGHFNLLLEMDLLPAGEIQKPKKIKKENSRYEMA